MRKKEKKQVITAIIIGILLLSVFVIVLNFIESVQIEAQTVWENIDYFETSPVDAVYAGDELTYSFSITNREDSYGRLNIRVRTGRYANDDIYQRDGIILNVGDSYSDAAVIAADDAGPYDGKIYLTLSYRMYDVDGEYLASESTEKVIDYLILPLVDSDDDGVVDVDDNCINIPNPNQEDADSDGIGDACDACPNDPDNDVDGDSICGDVDNCPNTYNPDQLDSDGDGIGDACEEVVPPVDSDNDGTPDTEDNCPDTYNPDQLDSDDDGIGDLCDDTPFVPDPEPEPEEELPPSTPGFELFVLVVAIGIILYFKRRKHD